MRLLLSLILSFLLGSAKNSPGADDSSSKIMDVFVSPAQELIVVQWKNLNTETLELTLCNQEGVSVQKTILYVGNTIAWFETQALYPGDYTIKISNGKETITHKITLAK